MVGVGLEVVVLIILLVLSIGLQLEARFSGMQYLNDYDDALDEMRNSLNVVAQVLHKLPEMVPQFSINENPLSQILQFFQQRAEQGSLDAERLRDDNGAYSDGTKKETKEK
jgi:hypothetical protein